MGFSMKFIRFLLIFSGLLRRLLEPFLKVRVAPGELIKHLDLDPTKSVCYVLQTRSITDLLVLEKLLKQFGLPRFKPQFDDLLKGESGFIYLAKYGILSSKKAELSKKLEILLDHVAKNGRDIQLVPVSIFWGRNPGNEKSNLFRTLFFDARHGGIWHKMFAVIFNGRQTLCNFGKPLSLKSFVQEDSDQVEMSRKIYRLIRVHFNRQTIAALGPELYDRKRVLASIVRSDRVQTAIEDLMNKKKISRAKAELAALKCIDEIASDISHRTVFLFDKFLSILWQKVYSGVEVRNEQYLAEIADGESIVYMPSHKSHMDYLLVCYVLYAHGMMSPHTAAGVNLNFWPIGGFLRKGGAFFLRRSFKGDRLYGACFNEYLFYLINKGFPVNFFPEGGRSRSGRLLKPKTGMLSMIIQTQLRMVESNITLVPVYISYDKIVEGRSYEKEQAGKKKKGESFLQLLGTAKILRSKMGHAYVSFGKPQKLRDYLEEHVEGWDQRGSDLERPAWLIPQTVKLASEMTARTNASVVVSPISVISLMLLSAPNRAMTRDDLHALSNIFYRWLRECKYDENTVVEDVDFAEALTQARELIGVEVLTHSLGDIVHVSEKRSLRLSYYSNTVLHLFVLPALIAYVFVKRGKRTVEDIERCCSIFFPFLKREFFLKWTDEEFNGKSKETLHFMVSCGLIEQSTENLYSAPELSEESYTYLTTMAGVLKQMLEFHVVGKLLLIEAAKVGEIDRDLYYKQLSYLLERMSILSGDSLAIRTIGEYRSEFNLQMRESGLIQLHDDGTLSISNKLKEMLPVLETLVDRGVYTSTVKNAKILVGKPGTFSAGTPPSESEDAEQPMTD